MRSLRTLATQSWLVYALGMTFVSLLYLLGGSVFNTGPLYNAIGLSAAIAILVGTRRMEPSQRLPWYLFAAGQALFVMGDVIAYNYQRFFHAELPFPSVADAFYLAFYPAIVLGMLILVRRRTPGRDRGSLIDSLIISIGIGVLSWVFLMSPYAHDESLGLGTKVISIAYPLMDILVLTVAARLAFAKGKTDFSFMLFMLGVVSLLMTDSVYGWLQLHGGYETGNLLDGGWICFYVVLGAAALHPSARSRTNLGLDADVTLTGTRLALLATATLAAPVVQAAMYMTGRRIDVPVVAAAGGTLFLLVVARMALLMRKQRESEARFSSLVRNSSDVVTLIDADMTIRYVSPSIERVLGYDVDELVGTSFSDLVPEPEVARVVTFFLDHDETIPAGPRLIEFAVRHQTGDWVEVETLRTNLLTDSTVEGIVLNTRDISERKAFERQLEQHAFYDTVTGLANRALFRNRVTHALAQAKRSRRNVAVVFMDLDDFKIVNDSFGHAVGDELLRAVGNRLRECLRDADTAARLGGDEFAILLEETGDDVTASDIGDRILHAFEAPLHVEGREIRVRASLGIAFGGRKQGEAATEELLRNADVAMYTAKGQGKGRLAIYEPTMHKSLLQRLELKGDLPRALENGEFTLHYQPLVTLETGVIHGFEALVRWEHPERGLVPPLEFIPLAEETGLIIPLGVWILQTACMVAKDLQTKFPQSPLGMSVNLSLRQLQSPSIVNSVKDALETSGLDPASLTLEVTESVMMSNVDISVLRLRELKDLGVHIAIDDFGAGYSSLSYIRQFPVDVFKVDKTFIDRIDQDGEELALTAAIIDLAKVLNLRPFAEGVERPEQLARLLELGCGGAQGYLFAKPETRADVELRLATQHEDIAAA